MNASVEHLQERLCDAFCRDVAVEARDDGYAVSLPLFGRGGDHFTLYLKETAGGWKVSDMGSTLMRLSYENDLSKLLSGAREKLFNTVLSEAGLAEEDGELFVEASVDELNRAIFSLSQGILRIEDLGLWSSARVENSFYDDLRSIIQASAGVDDVIENYVVPGVPNAENYPVDFFINTGRRPLYVFGVLNRDKARLTTIILQHLSMNKVRDFESMVVYADVDQIAKQDAKRLMNAANDTVASIDDRDVIQEKIKHRLKA